MKSATVRLTVAALGLGAIAFAVLADVRPHVVWNGSESVDRGFYQIEDGPMKRGDLVLTRIPEWAETLAWERHYYPQNIPLLKRIVAAQGDRICRIGAKIIVNGASVATAKKTDSLGHDMPLWNGCRVLDADKILLINAHAGSFDGRYFGATDRSLIIGRAVPVWTYQ